MDDATRALRERLYAAADFLRGCRGTEPVAVFGKHARTCDKAAALLAPADAEPDGWAVVDGDGAPLWAFWGEDAREKARDSGAYHDHPHEARIVPVYIGAAPERTVWRPIETAPKDGTAIVVRLEEPGFGVALACWTGGWHDVRSGEWGNQFQPTHWMPLPAPPGAAPERTAAQPEGAARLIEQAREAFVRYTASLEEDGPAQSDIDGVLEVARNIRLAVAPEGTTTNLLLWLSDEAYRAVFSGDGWYDEDMAEVEHRLAARAEPQGGTHGE